MQALTPAEPGLFTRSRLMRLIKFGVVGASGVLVNVVIFEVLHRFFGISFGLANATGIVVSIFTNFLLNDRWTWGDRAKGNTLRAWALRVGRYYISAGAAALVQMGVASAANAYIFVDILVRRPGFLGGAGEQMNLGPTLAVLSGIVVGMGINFFAGHLWAFRDAEDEVGS